jgi:hypothetical protein
VGTRQQEDRDVTQVRRPLIAALTLFTVAIALDRTGIGAGSDVVGTHAYAIAAGAILLPTLLPGFRRTRAIVPISTAVASLLGYSVLVGTGFFGDVGVHVAAIELSFVGLAASLGFALGAGLDQLDALVATIAVGDSPALDLEGPTAANEIHTEVARSRRHDRPLTVTVLAPTPDGMSNALDRAAIEVDTAIRRRFLYGTLAGTVSRVLRRSDLLFEHRPTGRFIVLSPETDGDGSALLLDRIQTATAAAGIATSIGSASFPEDGIGFETLIEEAERDLETRNAVPQLRAVEHGGAS